MNLGILAEIDNRSEVVVKTCGYRASISRGQESNVLAITFEAFEGFKHLDQLYRTQNVRIFGCDLDDNLEVLTDIHTEHLLQTCHGLLSCQTAEIADQPLLTNSLD
jgi:hypothetical protein